MYMFLLYPLINNMFYMEEVSVENSQLMGMTGT